MKLNDTNENFSSTNLSNNSKKRRFKKINFKKIHIEHKRRVILFTFLIFFISTLIYYIIYTGPVQIVENIGVENTYLILFLVAVFGGVSVFTSTSFYILFLTFLAGGSNPIVLAIVGGVGLSLGDMLFFILGMKGRDVIEHTRYEKYISKISKLIDKNSPYAVFALIYMYISFSPFPKDILSITLGILNYDIKRLFLAMIFGNITHCFVMIAILTYI
ncbi:MAG: VTT domain-containing protein [Nanoarchaeota archaeon]|nr:VTT domain-containing protein [Nanoarchaeota archaeon]